MSACGCEVIARLSDKVVATLKPSVSYECGSGSFCRTPLCGEPCSAIGLCGCAALVSLEPGIHGVWPECVAPFPQLLHMVVCISASFLLAADRPHPAAVSSSPWVGVCPLVTGRPAAGLVPVQAPSSDTRQSGCCPSTGRTLRMLPGTGAF